MRVGLSDETYEQIGRVAVAATGLEHILAYHAEYVLRDDFDKLISSPGKARTRAHVAAETLSDHELYPRLRAWVDDACSSLDDRNKVVHAFWLIVGLDHGDGSTIHAGEHTKSNSRLTTDAQLLVELPGRLEKLAARGQVLLHMLARKPGEPESIFDEQNVGRLDWYAPGVAQKMAASLGLRWVWTDELPSDAGSPPSS